MASSADGPTRRTVPRTEVNEGDRVRVSFTTNSHEYEQAAIDGVVSEVKHSDYQNCVRYVEIESQHDTHRIIYGGGIQRRDERAGWVRAGYLATIEREEVPTDGE